MKTETELFNAQISEQLHTIEKWRKAGYQLRFPGGSTRDIRKNFSSFNCIYTLTPTDTEVLVVPYKPYDYKNLKYEKKEDEEFSIKESPEGTLIRETLEETGITPKKFILLGRQIRTKEQAILYTKYSFATDSSDCDLSNLRAEPEEKGRSEPPISISLQLLKIYLYKKHFWQMNLLEKFLKNPKEYKSSDYYFSIHK